MRCDDIAIIHAKLKTEGLCSPKMLIDSAGWPDDGASRQKLAEIMDYLMDLRQAEKVPEGYWALDAFGRRVRRRLSTKLPPVKHPEVAKSTENKVPVKSSFDGAKANQVLAIMRSGKPLHKACEMVGITESMFKRWRNSSRVLNEEAKAAIRIAGNNPAEKAAAKYAEIQRMIREKIPYKAIASSLRCGKDTIRMAKAAMEDA